MVMCLLHPGGITGHIAGVQNRVRTRGSDQEFPGFRWDNVTWLDSRGHDQVEPDGEDKERGHRPETHQRVAPGEHDGVEGVSWLLEDASPHSSRVANWLTSWSVLRCQERNWGESRLAWRLV